MDDLLAAVVEFQMPLGDVSLMGSLVDKNLVPGLVLRRTGLRDVLVPFVTPCENRVDVVDHAAIVKAQMANRTADRELSVHGL